MCLSIGAFFSVSHHNFDFLFISSKPSLLFQNFNLATTLYHVQPLDVQTAPSPASSQPPFTSCPALPAPSHPPSPVSAPSSPQVGDQILEVNGRSFFGIPHDEAVRVLKSSHHLMMTVKDVGRLPHARTVVGETKWITSSQITDSSSSSSVTGWVTRWWECEETRKVREIKVSCIDGKASYWFRSWMNQCFWIYISQKAEKCCKIIFALLNLICQTALLTLRPSEMLSCFFHQNRFKEF